MESRVTRAVAHLPAEEVKRRMQRDPLFWCRQRWLLIYQALTAPCQAGEIATPTGISLSMARRVSSTSNRLGVAAIETPGTGGQSAKALAVPGNIRLIPQPAGRPELNPVEPIREDLREKQLPNLARPTLDDGVDRVCIGLQHLEAGPGRLRSMMYFLHFRPAA